MRAKTDNESHKISSGLRGDSSSASSTEKSDEESQPQAKLQILREII